MQYTLYVRPTCPHCQRAMDALPEWHLCENPGRCLNRSNSHVVNLDTQPRLHDRLKIETGQHTVPYVFRPDGRLVDGGSQGLIKLLRQEVKQRDA
jgi:glutaredoxin